MCMFPLPIYFDAIYCLIDVMVFLVQVVSKMLFFQVSPLIDIDKILDCEMRPTAAADSDAFNLGSKQIFVKQYLVKWKGLSYLHCTW